MPSHQQTLQQWSQNHTKNHIFPVGSRTIMRPTLYCCVLCGYLIDRTPLVKRCYNTGSDCPTVAHSWVLSVYSNAESTFISGIGCYEAPLMGIRIAIAGLNARSELLVMRQRPENGRHSFVIHNSCGHLLQKLFKPDGVPIERPLSIFKSLPFPSRGIGVFWGHNYGGLTTKDHLPMARQGYRHIQYSSNICQGGSVRHSKYSSFTYCLL